MSWKAVVFGLSNLVDDQTLSVGSGKHPCLDSFSEEK